MKAFWFSKTGKAIFKVVLWIVVWIFFIIWVIITRITYLQWNDYNQAPNVYEMIQNFMYDHWLWDYKNNNNDSFGRYIDLNTNWKDEVIAVDDSFTQWEWEWRYFYIKLPSNSKFFHDAEVSDAIYWEELDDYWNRIIKWYRIHEIKIEVEDGTFIQSFPSLGRNPGKDHVWERNAWIIDNWPRRFSDTGPWWEEWQTMCIILTPQNTITQTELSTHDEWCEFWSLPQNDYDETYLNLIISGKYWKAKVKMSHITVDLPRNNEN